MADGKLPYRSRPPYSPVLSSSPKPPSTFNTAQVPTTSATPSTSASTLTTAPTGARPRSSSQRTIEGPLRPIGIQNTINALCANTTSGPTVANRLPSNNSSTSVNSPTAPISIPQSISAPHIPSNQPQELPFAAPYVVLHNASTNATHIPTVRYIFDDDDPDILTQALAEAHENIFVEDPHTTTNPSKAILVDLAPRFSEPSGSVVGSSATAAPLGPSSAPGSAPSPSSLLSQQHRYPYLQPSPTSVITGWDIVGATSLTADFATTAAHFSHTIHDDEAERFESVSLPADPQTAADNSYKPVSNPSSIRSAHTATPLHAGSVLGSSPHLGGMDPRGDPLPAPTGMTTTSLNSLVLHIHGLETPETPPLPPIPNAQEHQQPHDPLNDSLSSSQWDMIASMEPRPQYDQVLDEFQRRMTFLQQVVDAGETRRQRINPDPAASQAQVASQEPPTFLEPTLPPPSVSPSQYTSQP